MFNVKNRRFAVGALLILMLGVGAFGGGFYVGATLPTQDGVWGQWFRDAYVWVSTALHLDYGGANGVLYLNSGKNVTTDADLQFDGTTFTATQLGATRLTGAVDANGQDITDADDVNATDVFVAGDAWIYNGTAYENITDTLIYSESEADYIIWVEGATYYAKNGHTGQVTTSTNFSSLIQGKINIIRNTTVRGTIFLKTGYYIATATINSYPGIAIVADSQGWKDLGGLYYMGATIHSDINSPIISITNDPWLTAINEFAYLKNICIEGSNNSSKTSQKGVWVHEVAGGGISDMYIDNIMIKNTYDALYIECGGKIFINKGYIENNRHHGIYFSASTGGYIKNMYIYNNLATQIFVVDTGFDGLLIEGNEIKAPANQNCIFGWYSGKVCRIIGNSIYGVSSTGTTGVDVQVNTVDKHYIITGNTFYNLNKGIYVETGGAWVNKTPYVSAALNDFISVATPYSTNFSSPYTSSIKITQNQGYVTENWVTVANTTSTTFVFNHNVAGDLDAAGSHGGVWATFDPTTTAALTRWSWTSTATQVTITVVGTGLPATMTARVYIQYIP